MTFTDFGELKQNPKSSTRDTPYLTIDTFQDVIIKKKIDLSITVSVVEFIRYCEKQ